MSVKEQIEAKKNSYITKWNILLSKPEQWLCFIPDEDVETYPCFACQTLFRARSSFLDHVNRRGLFISYKCRLCSHKLVLRFYNPCSFLLHCRKHFLDNNLKINLDHITIKQLPIGMAGFSPHPSVPELYNVKEDYLGNEKHIKTEFYIAKEECKGKPFVFFKATTLQFEVGGNTRKCLELKQISMNIPHCKFITRNNNNSSNFTENFNINFIQDQTSKTNSSKLILVKETLNNNLQIIEDKIKRQDENDRTLKMICFECNSAINGTLFNHFSSNGKPNSELWKCKICNYIATTKCSLKAHERIHLEKEPYLCPECGAKFNYFSQLVTHASDICYHFAKQVRVKCGARNCGKIFAHIETYKTHFAIHVISMSKCQICSIKCASDEEFASHMKMHNSNLPPIKLYTCSICDIGMQHEYISHINSHLFKENSFVYVYICRHCNGFFKTASTYAIHIAKCKKNVDLNNKKYKINNLLTPKECMYCETVYLLPYSNNSLLTCPCCQITTKSNRLTNESFVELNECILCKKALSVPDLKTHLLNMQCPYVKPVVQLKRLLPEEINTYIKEGDESQTKRKKRSSNKSKKTVQIRIAKDNQADDPIPFNGTYNCYLCEFAHEDRDKFHEHIIQHRDISTCYQCMECGECFVVKPSLQKHLLHFHQISDEDSYLKENNCCDEQAIRGLNGHLVKENQCSVCLKEFDQELELKKHFRVHGMAFLIHNSK